MLLLLGLLQAILFVFLFRKAMMARPNIFYIGSAIVSVLLGLYGYFGLAADWPEWTYTYIISTFYRGAFSTSLFIVVMYTGALNTKYSLTKKLYGVRAQLSIIASIITLGHNLVYGYAYFPALFTNPGSIPTNRLIATIITIVLLIIMIPLMVTSFPSIRKRMKALQWKKLQRWAYLFYFLIYVHVIVLFIPYVGNKSYGFEYIFGILAYTIVFGLYAVLRINKYIRTRNRRSSVVAKAGEIR